MVAEIGDKTFSSERGLAAWIALVPKQHSTGGKDRLGSITKQGNRYLRRLPPRRALGPAAIPPASIGWTRDRTRPMLQKCHKVLANAPSTRDAKAGVSVGKFSAICAAADALTDRVELRTLVLVSR